MERDILNGLMAPITREIFSTIRLKGPENILGAIKERKLASSPQDEICLNCVALVSSAGRTLI